MPDDLSFGVEAGNIGEWMYMKALGFVFPNPSKTIRAVKRQGLKFVFFVLSGDGENKVRALTDTNIAMYEQLLGGIIPSGTGGSWLKVCEVKNSMYMLKQASLPWHVAECDANPYKLQCPCKDAAHKGICKHCLATNYLKLLHNYHKLILIISTLLSNYLQALPGNKLPEITT